MYKVITKIVAARLGRVLRRIVNKAQSASYQARKIVDNVLIAHELVRNYCKRIGLAYCAMKVDLKKAYDSVQWDLLRRRCWVWSSLIDL